MSIVSSTFVLDSHNQIDGRVYVTETHTDAVGGKHVVEYLATADMNHADICAARAIQISDSLAEAEADSMLAG